MARVVITAVVLEGRSKSEDARDYGVSRRWVQVLVARYLAEGEAAFGPRSRRPLTNPHRTDAVRQLQRVQARPGQAPAAKASTLMTMKVVSVHRPGAVAALRARASSARRARAGVVAVHQGFERRSSQASVSPSPAP